LIEQTHSLEAKGRVLREVHTVVQDPTNFYRSIVSDATQKKVTRISDSIEGRLNVASAEFEVVGERLWFKLRT
jgi:hypothetical protein